MLGVILADELIDERKTDFEVMPCNWESVWWFMEMGTQWRAGFGGRIGLDYTAVITTLRLHAVARKRAVEIMDDLRVMEFAALEYEAKRREKS